MEWATRIEATRSLFTYLPQVCKQCVAMACPPPPVPGGWGELERGCKGVTSVWSALIGQAKGEGGRVLSVATICLQSQVKIHHISNFLIHIIFKPPVATYGSCFQTYQVILI
jgi:hypothetical protein